MLYEDDVVRAVMARLRADGWTIRSFALSHQHGDDIVATRAAVKLVIEAKGEGSSKVGTRRHGLFFTRNQVKTHVAVAVMRALRVVSEGDAIAGIALPDNPAHRADVDPIAPTLDRLGVLTYWAASTE